MTGPAPAVAACRVAVRRALTDLPHGSLVLVACSGGTDSLALAAAAAFEVPRLGGRVGALVIDHGLQAGSAEVSLRAATQCRDLGLDPVEVLPVQVARSGDGPEAEARAARHTALEAARRRLGAAYLLLGHTRDDQAEQVLLGLARGSGARSLSGMPRARGRLLRPLLDVDRSVTREACAAQGLTPWEDPHNADPAYRRVRARGLLRELEAQLGPGIGAALARSADLLRDDADALADLAASARADLGDGPWPVRALQALPVAVRRRVLRLLLLEGGAGAGSLSAAHVDAVDALLTAWRGQGPVALPGLRQAQRHGDRLSVSPTRRVQ